MNIPFADFIDVFGTFSFAVAGAIAAMQKKLDVFGVLIMAFVTAIGGGTIRDFLTGDLPVSWLRNPRSGWVIAAGAVGALFFGGRLKRIHSLLFVFDALGLGLFTLIGIQKGMNHALAPGVCIALGTVTGCFGGVLRDVVLNKVPLIFQKEIYASASIVGGCLYFVLLKMPVSPEPAAAISILLIFAVRMLAVRFNWHLPVWSYPNNFHKKR
jgi:uncharacterized membrane protein YeiH